MNKGPGRLHPTARTLTETVADRLPQLGTPVACRREAGVEPMLDMRSSAWWSASTLPSASTGACATRREA